MPNSAEIVLKLQSNVAPQIAAAAQSFTTLSKEEQKAAQSATTYAQSLNRLAIADAATATQEQRLAQATANAAKAQTQAEGAALRLASVQAKVASGSTFATQTADAFTSSLTSMIGPAALAAAAIGAVKGSLDLAVAGENVNRVGRSFASLTAQAQSTGPAILAALRAASGGEVSNLNLQLATNKGLLLGVANSAAQFSDLMLVARDRAAKMGIDTTQAFDNIATGIGRGSPLILDNLGIVVDISAAHATYAAQIGKSVDELTKQERTIALTNAVIAQGKAGIDESATAINNQANAYARLGIVIQNTKDQLGGFLATNTQGTVTSIGGAITGTTQLASAFGRLSAATSGATSVFGAIVNPIGAYNNLVLQGIADGLAWAGAIADVGAAGTTQAGAFDEDRVAIGKLQLAAEGAIPVLAAVVGAASAAAAASGATRTPRHITDRSSGPLSDHALSKDGIAQAKFDAERARLQDARDRLALSRATTAAQKIALLKRQQAATSDPVERLNLQGQIESEIRAGAKSHTGELGRQLGLHTAIASSLADQYRSQLDAQALSIRDRQERRKEDQQLAQAQRILADPSKARFADAARDSIALIGVSRAQRAGEIAAKGPIGALAPALPPKIGGGPALALPNAPAGGAAPSGAGGGAGGVEVNVYVDGAAVAASVVTRLRQGLRQSQSAGGGG